ncbi:MAG: hypothetical protein GEV03_07055 [Streptosporangiales bacterium]|nr:hypothetical protein [Streptosporangiales bacterium]
MTSTPRTQPRQRGQPDPLRLMGRLSGRDRLILRTLADHHVLTTDQITDLAFDSLRAAQQRLVVLDRLGVVGRFRDRLPAGSQPWRYYLAPAGAAIIAAERGQPAPAPSKVRARAIALAASQRLPHLLGVNGFFTALAAAARTSAGTCALEQWWPERRCAAEYGELVRPDAYGVWRQHRRRVGFFLEHDQATEPTARAAAKLAGYADLAIAEDTPVVVLFWLPSPDREASLRPELERAAPRAVTVATATPTPGPASRPSVAAATRRPARLPGRPTTRTPTRQ